MLNNIIQHKGLYSAKGAALLIFLYTILPFLLLCIFNVPLGDDLWYASEFRENGMLGTQLKYYHDWSGRYMATFLISTLNPLSYGYLNFAFVHPLILLVGTATSLKLLTNQIITFFDLAVDKLLFFSILFFFYMNYLPDVGESFYWMAGAYTYQIPVIFMFFYLTLLLKIFGNSSTKNFVVQILLSIICIFVIIGSNEVMTLYLCCFNSLLFLFYVVLKRKFSFTLFSFLIITVVLSYFMFFAEGNFARQQLFEQQSFHSVKSGVHALVRSLFVLFFWIPTLLLMLLCIPGFSTYKTPQALVRFIPRISVKFLISSCLTIIIAVTFVGFFPSIYATNWIPQRAYTPIFAIFILLFIALFLLLANQLPALSKLNGMLTNTVSAPALLLILVLSLSHNSNVMNAFLDISSGKASSHHQQVMNAYQDLQSASPTDTIIVNEIAKRPLILPMRWPQKHNKLANVQWQRYFNVKSVELE